MPLLTVTKSYADSTTVSLTDADLDSIATSIEDFINVSAGGGIDDLNIQDDGITASTKLKDDTISTAKIADAAVTNPKLADMNPQISSSTGSFTTASASLVDVTNASVTITTTGRPVMLFLQPDGSASAYIHDAGTSGETSFAIIRDTTTVAQMIFEPANTGVVYTPGIVRHIDVPAAGTYTYKVQVAITSGNTDVLNCRLVAFEIW